MRFDENDFDAFVGAIDGGDVDEERVVWDWLFVGLVDVVRTESNIVSWTRRANGNSPRLQNKPV